MVWLRWFRLLFGNTAYAASATLAAFFLGLALGSWWFARVAGRSPRPLGMHVLVPDLCPHATPCHEDHREEPGQHADARKAQDQVGDPEDAADGMRFHGGLSGPQRGRATD